MRKFFYLFILVCFANFSLAQIQLDETTLTEREVINGLDVPWEIKWGPDNHIWVTERSGLISRVNVETGQQYPILNLASQLFDSGESGLLGMEIHPDFNNGAPYVFLAYTYGSQSNAFEKIVYYEYDAENDALINEMVIVDGIDGNSTHIGCRLLAIDNTTLLVTTGDAQDWMASQNETSLTGKTLRIDIDANGTNFGNPKADNPNAESYVWSIGHRNAQGLAIAPNGIIYSSEHGPNNDDELNILQAGNFGWPNVQGFCDDQWVDTYYAEDLTSNYTESDYCQDNNIIEPLWSSGSSTIAPSDIIWYDHPSIPEFQNSLLMTVLKSQKLVRFTFNASGDIIESETDFFTDTWGRLRDICISPDGKIYLATNGYTWPSQGPNDIIELYNADYIAEISFNCIDDACVDPTDGTGTYSSLADCEQSCSVSITENQLSKFPIYPNPISPNGVLNIPSESFPFTVEILNLQGQQVYSKLMTKNTLSLERKFEQGVYFIKTENTFHKILIK
ncbi:MAG: PQQ-dependent sugar dehydrogenase [Flavobacteriales bacterium]